MDQTTPLPRRGLPTQPLFDPQPPGLPYLPDDDGIAFLGLVMAKRALVRALMGDDRGAHVLVAAHI